MKEVKNLINNQNFLVQGLEKGETVTPCMDVYKAKIKSDGSLDKLKLRVVVIGDLQNKYILETIGHQQLTLRIKTFLGICC